MRRLFFPLCSTLVVTLFFLSGGIYPASAYDWRSDWKSVSCGGVYNLCGYKDRLSEKMMIAWQFEKAKRFSFGKAAVRLGGKWGYINDTGKIVIKPQFDEADIFKSGLAEIRIDGKSGIINERGEIVVEPQFARAIPFSKEVLFAVPHAQDNEEQSRRHYFTRYGQPKFSPDGASGLYHISKGWLTKAEFYLRYFDAPERGLVWARKNDRDSRWGLINMKGEFVVEPAFDRVAWLSENRATVWGDNPEILSLADKKSYRAGAVDGTGKLVIPLEFASLTQFKNGFAVATSANIIDPYNPARRYGLIDPDGNLVGGKWFDKVIGPQHNVPAQVRLDGIWYNLRDDGALDQKDTQGDVLARCKQGLKVVRKRQGYQVQNAAGEVIYPDILSSVSFNIKFVFHKFDLSRMHKELDKDDVIDCKVPIIVSIGDVIAGDRSSGLVSADGKPMFTPDSFDSMHYFAGGYTVVHSKGKSAIIDIKGNFITPMQDETITPFADTEQFDGGPFFWVDKKDGNRAYINAQGEKIELPKELRDDESPARVLKCIEGAMIFTPDEGKHWGIKNANGAVLIKPHHKAISCFVDGIVYVPDEEKRKWCAIDRNNVLLGENACISVYYPVIISHHYPEKFSDDPFESSLIWIQNLLKYGIGKRDKPPGWVGDGVMSHKSFTVMPFK